VILPVVSTLPTWGLLPADWRPWRGWRAAGLPGVARELLGFSRWMLVTNVGSIITAQLDLLLLGRLATPATVGVYSVALTLALRLDTLNQSLFTVLMPRASRLAGAAAIRQYSRRVLAGTLALAAGLGVVALAAVLLLPLLYGDQYRDSAGLFAALTGIVLFDLVTASLFLLAFPLNRPQVLALAEWLRLAVLGIAGWLLIPLYGAYGAVGARFLSRTLGTTYTLWALRRALHGLGPTPEPDTAPANLSPEERGITCATICGAGRGHWPAGWPGVRPRRPGSPRPPGRRWRRGRSPGWSSLCRGAAMPRGPTGSSPEPMSRT
jgi:O-antigen/teichoic acid export membrane protein